MRSLPRWRDRDEDQRHEHQRADPEIPHGVIVVALGLFFVSERMRQVVRRP
jgi:hypothetical protein